MTADYIIKQFKKGMTTEQLQEMIIEYGKDRSHTILVLTGKSNCDAGHLVKKHKRIFI